VHNQLEQVFIELMVPKKDLIPRKRSGSLVIIEPTDTSLIDKDPHNVDSFKHMCCWRFFQKLQGHHLQVSKDFVQNYQEGKTKFGPVEIHLTANFIAKVTKIPRSGECWYKEKKIEKEGWCQDMIKPKLKEANLTKGVPRIWLLEEYDRLLFIIQRFFTCEGRYSWVL
jgi:hypothetical protein